jgi:putative ABC transport system permease protein
MISRLPGLRRTLGAAAGSTLALALLAGGCVFAAMAGPALSLHTRTEALQQTLAGLPSTTKTVQVGGSWGDFTQAVHGAQAQPTGGPNQNLDSTDLAASTGEMASGLAAAPLPLAGGDWASLTTNLLLITAGAAASAQAAAPPKMEVSYRDPFASHAQLVAGTFSSASAPRGTVAVTASTQTAARFGLHPGSRMTLAPPSGSATLYVTAIIRERGAGSTFWTQDSTVAVPSLVIPPNGGLPYWVGGVIADPNQLTAIQDTFGGPGLELGWEFPLAVGGVNADQAQGLYNALNHATTLAPALGGALQAGANSLTVGSPLLQQLSGFLATQAAIATVLLLLFVSLVVVGAAVILLAARMIVARRDGELTMLRARGGSLRQVGTLMLRAALIAAGPGMLIGAALAIALIPGGSVSSVPGWSLAAIGAIAALGGPPLIAIWLYRRPAPASNPARITTAETGRPRVAWRRPVAEVTAIAASVAGLVVLHDQGVPAAGGTDLYLTMAPVLVAIPIVLITLRLYPLAVRGLLAVSARGAGATGFVALSRAARSSLTGVLPAFALVLALSLATFAGMVSQGVTRGETAASWQTTGADALIVQGPYSPPITSAAARAIAAVHGVRHATKIWNTSWVTPYGQPVTVVAVDPTSYAAVVAGTPFPAFPAAKIGTAPGGIMPFDATVRVLASPSAAAVLGTGATQLNSLAAMGPFKVQVAGILSGTPAQPGGGAFVIMPLQTLPGPAGQPLPNTVLVTGSAINDAQLSAVAQRVIPGSILTFRSAVLASLASSPLQHGAALIIVLTIAAAAGFGLFIVILGLALGSAERELTLARLTVMGHERAVGLVLAEAMPAVIAAIVAGAVCAVALPPVIGSSIDLSAFTGTSAPVQFEPDALAVGLPAVIIGVLALVALVAEARALRRRGVIGMLWAN